MKSIKFMAVVLTSAAFIFVGCSKKTTKEEDPKPSASSILTGKDWIMIGNFLTPEGGSPLDVYASMPPCEKDNLLYFESGGSIWQKSGETKCSTSESDSTFGGTWKFINDDKQLMKISGDTTIGTVMELTATTFKIDIVKDEFGTKSTNSISYKKN